jgi:predicted kinase
MPKVSGQSIVIDVVHSQTGEREPIEKVARENGVAFTGIWPNAPTELLPTRLCSGSTTHPMPKS